MQKAEKAKIIAELSQEISESEIGILTEYRGLTVAQITELRLKLAKVNARYRVVKNTLARFAVENAKLPEAAPLFEGPTALATTSDDPAALAKVLSEYMRTSKSALIIKSGFLSERILTEADITTIAKLPSREVLLGQVLRGLQSPIYGLVTGLASPLRGFVGILQARIQQMEEAS